MAAWHVRYWLTASGLVTRMPRPKLRFFALPYQYPARPAATRRLVFVGLCLLYRASARSFFLESRSQLMGFKAPELAMTLHACGIARLRPPRQWLDAALTAALPKLPYAG